MSAAIERQTRNADGRITRRNLLLSVPALMLAPTVLPRAAMVQTGMPPIVTRRLNNVMISVSDLKRSVEFYQGLFGAPVQQGGVAVFRIGAGPHFFALTQVTGTAKPDFLSYGLTVDHFDPDALLKTLVGLGVAGAKATARDGTPELWAPDPDGISIQLQHTAYGRGSGRHGEVLPTSPKSTAKPAFQLKSLSHVTLTVTNGPRSKEFYTKVLGLRPQAMQASTACMALGSGPDFIAIPTTANNPNAKAGVNHVCFAIDGFDPNRVMGILAQHGLEPIEYGVAAAIKPLTCRTRLRQRSNNGGGPTHPLGTPELYFNDPDNITIQIQDVKYCGGSGALGEICP